MIFHVARRICLVLPALMQSIVGLPKCCSLLNGSSFMVGNSPLIAFITCDAPAFIDHFLQVEEIHLVGGLEPWNFISHILRRMSPTDEVHHFSDGWLNHQPVMFGKFVADQISTVVQQIWGVFHARPRDVRRP